MDSRRTRCIDKIMATKDAFCFENTMYSQLANAFADAHDTSLEVACKQYDWLLHPLDDAYKLDAIAMYHVTQRILEDTPIETLEDMREIMEYNAYAEYPDSF